MQCEPTTHARNRRFLADLPRRGPTAYPLFVRALMDSGQGHIGRQLRDTERKLMAQLQQPTGPTMRHGDPPPVPQSGAGTVPSSTGSTAQINPNLLNYGIGDYFGQRGPTPMDTSTQRPSTPPPMQVSSGRCFVSETLTISYLDKKKML